MDSIAGIGLGLLSQSEQRLEIAAENVANMSVPGYLRRMPFSTMLSSSSGLGLLAGQTTSFVDLRPGKLQPTGNPTDLAIVGDGFFVVRNQAQAGYTRGGQFTRTSDGRLVTSEGLALQATDGGDVVLQAGDFTVAPDGVVTQAGAPVARVAVGSPPKGAALLEKGAILTGSQSDTFEGTSATIRQGAVESSNVSMGDEMVLMMEALRRAETAQRLVNVYDDLMGRIIAAEGQG